MIYVGRAGAICIASVFTGRDEATPRGRLSYCPGKSCRASGTTRVHRLAELQGGTRWMIQRATVWHGSSRGDLNFRFQVTSEGGMNSSYCFTDLLDKLLAREEMV